ncbi:DUF4350 domain-containing protein [Mangrovimonas sp. YM274]|uniref:DUF4350 domain-containing protein n=1 Tax=Mangrovimonas sp. YM274 TaxID=3070660 RepID=UPI0027DD7EAE|nr:DUF4350 domain-containing protein [Mangrovimonas sp. YM274]WMI67705.1 DUF4350 domain-containing protein [Mangrovimonas sp. YM274]
MNRKGKIYIALAVFTLLSIVALEATKPNELNWFPSYAKHHKIPMGTYVFHEQLDRLFAASKPINLDRPPFEYLENNPDVTGTYVFINNDINFGQSELDRLLDWTSNGNTLFVASSALENQLLDTLKLETSYLSQLDGFGFDYELQLKNKALYTDKVTFNNEEIQSSLLYFSSIDTLNSKVVGVVEKVNSSDSLKVAHPNIIKTPFGEGTVIVSLFPQAFTNYFMLTAPNQQYAASLMSYFSEEQPIYLDQYHKSGKIFYSSPLYLMLNNKHLKWAYYIMLIGVVFYIIFEGKRKQRAIPIVNPLRNQTLDFTRTIANMYFEKGNHHDIALHKIQHFMDYIRTQLYLSTETINTEFIKNLAARSNNSVEATKTLLNTIESISNTPNISASELETLNNLIETFKSKHA